MTRREVADRLGLAETSLNRLCRGVRRPSIEVAFAIEKLTKGKVPAAYWQKVPPHSED
jgi:DNA-binding transcriptional regulator YdaS (Cro superfamily)